MPDPERSSTHCTRLGVSTQMHVPRGQPHAHGAANVVLLLATLVLFLVRPDVIWHLTEIGLGFAQVYRQIGDAPPASRECFRDSNVGSISSCVCLLSLVLGMYAIKYAQVIGPSGPVMGGMCIAAAFICFEIS